MDRDIFKNNDLPETQPIVLTVFNYTGVDGSNIPIFGAYNEMVTGNYTKVPATENAVARNGIAGGYYKYQSSKKAGVQYNVQGEDYYNLLYDIMERRKVINHWYLESNTYKQLTNSFKNEWYYGNLGEGQFRSVSPQVNLYQTDFSQVYVTEMNHRLVLNGSTKITLNNVYTGGYIKLYLYPSVEENEMARLESKSSHKFRQKRLSGLIFNEDI